MDHIIPIGPTNPSLQPFGSNVYVPGVYFAEDNDNGFLSSLDSDTRDYVLKHTDEYRTRQDIEDCISELHGKR